MDTIYQNSVNTMIQDLSEQIGQIKLLSTKEPVWSEPRRLMQKKKGRWISLEIPGKPIGVYRIIYLPTMETMSIGMGWVKARLGRHRSVFLNKGVVIKTPNSYSGSQTAHHMYDYDNKKSNWGFSWAELGNRTLSERYEKLLQESENPRFNSLSMAGK